MGKTLALLTTLIGVGLALFHMVLTQSAFLPSVLVQDVHLGVSLVLIALVVASLRRGAARAWALAVAIAAAACAIYVAARYDTLINAGGFPSALDVVLGVVLLALVFEGTRLQWGAVLPVLSLVTLGYYVFGHLIPASWAAPHTPFASVISNVSIGLYSGLFGQFMAISANDIFLFMVFGGLLEALDGNRPFNEIGKAIGRVLPGGSGLTTVVSSGLMGMVTGAAVSNVAICGTYTIPFMKREGYSADTAAAIEATASTGGQLVPPVMGSVAFIMAALLAVPYFQIVVTAIIPAAFYYVSVFAAVYLLSRRIGIRRQQESPDQVQLWFYLPLFVVPLVVMTILLATLRSVAYAAFYSILVLVGVRLALVFVAAALPAKLRARLYREGVPPRGAELSAFAVKLIAGLRNGALAGAGIAAVMGTVGVLSESVTATGAAVPLGWAVEAISGGSLFLALLSTAIMCLILGCGIPTVGAYVLTAAIAAPIAIGNGLDPYTVHFFILYYACLSAITPPIAAAALAASAIAGSRYFRTAWEATLLAAMLYLLPFLFVYEPALLARDMPGFWRSAGLLAEVTLICLLVAAATQGFLLRSLAWWERLLIAGAALAAMLHVCGAGAGYLVLSLGLAAASVIWQVTSAVAGSPPAMRRPVPPPPPESSASR
ncbi:MAG: TRAP transporter fused permease subunit [Betaproteobacteria bacterium]|nr:MAG: TRAP transporter fused permease subunit [Betaproteobacteria bacterium]